MLTILSCQRATCNLTVYDPASGNKASCSPLVDTGSEYTALSRSALGRALNGSPGPGVMMHVGGMSLPTVFYPNARVEVLAEAHGQGPSTARSMGNFPPPYQGFDGILGVDMLDALSVDPVKDVARRRAYFAIRV
jgi:hypothetical protein